MEKMSFLNRDVTTTLKGVAVLLVMLQHAGAFGFGNIIFAPFGGIEVAIFLFLSGFGLTESYKLQGLTLFWKKKMLRILVPYIMWLPIYYLMCQTDFPSLPTKGSFPLYWFINYLLIWYVVFYISLRFFRQYAMYMMMLASIALFFLFPSTLQAEQSLSFISGVFVSFHWKRFVRINTFHSLLVASLLLLLGVAILGVKQFPEVRVMDVNNVIMKLLNLVMKYSAGLSLIVLGALYLRGRVLVVGTIGMMSYELYLVHQPFYESILHNWLTLLVFIVQSFVLAYVLFLLDRKAISIWK